MAHFDQIRRECRIRSQNAKTIQKSKNGRILQNSAIFTPCGSKDLLKDLSPPPSLKEIKELSATVSTTPEKSGRG